jgi:hypothetical protein
MKTAAAWLSKTTCYFRVVVRNDNIVSCAAYPQVSLRSEVANANFIPNYMLKNTH